MPEWNSNFSFKSSIHHASIESRWFVLPVLDFFCKIPSCVPLFCCSFWHLGGFAKHSTLHLSVFLLSIVQWLRDIALSNTIVHTITCAACFGCRNESSNVNGCDFENKRRHIVKAYYWVINIHWFCASCHCAYFSGIYHSHWKVVYCFSLGIQTHARDVVYILWLVVDLMNY